MPWIYLILAGIFEVGWAISLKYTNGLYVDVDDVASNSVKAKIEAFIRLG